MLTQTHAFLSVALFGLGRSRGVVLAAIAGALVPDSDVWLMSVVELLRGTPGCDTYHYRYLEQPWTTLQAVMNSFPVYGAFLFCGIMMWFRGAWFAGLVMVFSLSAVLHLAADFLLHHDDARRHFWPFSDWIFRSPVSYWDPNHFGRYFSVAEMLAGGSLAFILWQYATGFVAKAAIILACFGYTVTIVASLMGRADHDRGPGSCERMRQVSAAASDLTPTFLARQHFKIIK